MANPSVLTQFANPDPDAAPLNIVQLVTLLNTLVSSEILGSYIPYVISHSEPNVNDRDKAWIYVDTQGRPVEIRTWWAGGSPGSWRRIYNGMPGEIRMYSGNPAQDFDTNGLGYPPGTHAGTYDGWHLCNGQDGIVDLSDRFIVGAHMTDGVSGGYIDGVWKSKVEDPDKPAKQLGGVREITLTEKTTYNVHDPVVVGRYKIGSGGETADNNGLLFGNPAFSSFRTTLLDAADNGTPDPINIINPYIALGYIAFVGYST